MEPYEDARFENVVDEDYHCPICMNVLKEPVMCQRNEHYFCNECITKHLENSQTCPTCKDKLTAETLQQPQRIVTNCLLNFKIRCDYLQRGCRDIVRLEDLKTHHESEVCDFRRVKCHDFAEVKKELAEIKLQLGMMKEIKDLMIGMKEEIVVSVKQAVRDQTVSRSNARENVIVAGGYNTSHPISGGLKSVEMFSWENKSWISLPYMNYCCDETSLVTYKNEIIAVGGGFAEKMEKINLDNRQESEKWSDFPARLPSKFEKQKCLVYQDRLFVIGGLCRIDDSPTKFSNGMYQIKLSPPHTIKQLASMPQPRCFHGVERFDSDVFIFGGSTENNDEYSLDSVLKYDVIKNEITEMTPLPFAMNGMATVACGEHAVLMGGCNVDGEMLDTVLMYSFKTGQVKMLPHMLNKRGYATAVITGNVIVVMGGQNENWEYLSSVESFSFDRFSWEELPPMKEARTCAAAVLKPNNFS